MSVFALILTAVGSVCTLGFTSTPKFIPPGANSATQSVAPGLLNEPGRVVSPRETAAELTRLHSQLEEMTQRVRELVGATDEAMTRLDIFHGYMGVFVAAFVVALIATPLMRRLAIANGIIDRPTEARKAHRVPVAYLGGVGVFLGLLAGVMFAYTAPFHGLLDPHPTAKGDSPALPVSILLGMTVIMLCGLWDDVLGLDPRAKIAGQLFAAAALATNNVGVKLAAGLMLPIAKALGIPTMLEGGIETVAFSIPLPFVVLGVDGVYLDLVYWVGTAIIAVFVLGGCNASNLIDGLDGLLSGVTAIAAAGLLIVALGLALNDNGPLDGARLVLCMALLGACLGFLPHNFNPATIFLGDTGSLLLGYCTIVIILTLGDTGRTDLVLAGLIIYAIPIIDTTLAIARRKISDADDQHLHHMLKRSLGVKGAVLTLYGIGVLFATLGVALSEGRGRVIYAFTLVFLAFIGVISFKIARRDHIEKQAIARAGGAGAGTGSGPPKPLSPAMLAPNGAEVASAGVAHGKQA